jgi:hypothetical protein
MKDFKRTHKSQTKQNVYAMIESEDDTLLVGEGTGTLSLISMLDLISIDEVKLPNHVFVIIKTTKEVEYALGIDGGVKVLKI